MILLRASIFVLIASLVSTLSASAALAGGSVPYDLLVTMSGEPVGTGEVLTFSITVANTGAGMVDPVLVRSSVPEGTVFDSASSTNGVVNHPDVGATGPVECTARSFESGDRVVVKLRVRVIAEAGSSVTASAAAVGPNDGAWDADPDDNVTRTAVPVRTDGATADLNLAVDPDSASAGSGAPFGFNVRVTNRAANATATGVIVRAETPTGTTLAESFASGEVLTPNPGHRGAVICTFDAISPGETETLYVTFNVTGSIGSRVELTASVASSVDDPEPDDNAATSSVAIVQSDIYDLSWDFPVVSSSPILPAPQHVVATKSGSAQDASGNFTGSDQNATSGRTLVALHVYSSTRPDVKPSAATFTVTVTATATMTSLPVAPGGTFFVVTSQYDDGESGPSNEASANVPAAVLRNVNVTGTKIVANGTGFSPNARVFVDGIPFVGAATVKRGSTRVVQNGQLLSGDSIAEYLARNSTVLVTFRNANGGIAAYRYSR